MGRAWAGRGIQLPHPKVHLYGRSRGWAVPNPRKQRPRSRCRYDREHSGSLLHTAPQRTSLLRPHVILYEDDASRMVLAGGEFPEESTDHAIEVLDEARATAASSGLTIRQLNTDRGTSSSLRRSRTVRGLLSDGARSTWPGRASATWSVGCRTPKRMASSNGCGTRTTDTDGGSPRCGNSSTGTTGRFTTRCGWRSSSPRRRRSRGSCPSRLCSACTGGKPKAWGGRHEGREPTA